MYSELSIKKGLTSRRNHKSARPKNILERHGRSQSGVKLAGDLGACLVSRESEVAAQNPDSGRVGEFNTVCYLPQVGAGGKPCWAYQATSEIPNSNNLTCYNCNLSIPSWNGHQSTLT
eukprot:2503441-Amphidinium_carterae.1